MSGELPSATRTHTTLLDYLGLGIVLAPPPILLELWIRHEPVDWVRAGIGYVVCIVFGAGMIWLSKRKTGHLLGSLASLRNIEGHIWARALIVVAIVFGTLGLQAALSPSGLPAAANLPPSPASSLPRQVHHWTETDTATRAELQKKIEKIHWNAGDAVSQLETQLSDWELNIQSLGKQRFVDTLLNARNRISETSIDIEKILIEYPAYTDLFDEADQCRMIRQQAEIMTLAGAVSSLPSPLPPEWQEIIRPAVAKFKARIRDGAQPDCGLLPTEAK